MNIGRANGRVVNVLLIALVIAGAGLVYYVVSVSAASPATITPHLIQVGAGQTASITVSWSAVGESVPYTVYLYQSPTSSSCGTSNTLLSAKTGLSTPGFTFTIAPTQTSYYCGTVAGLKGSSAVSAIATATIIPALTVPSLTLSPNSIDSGQVVTLTATVKWTQGVSPYTVTLYTGSNITCSLDTTKASVVSGSNPSPSLTGTSATFSVKDPASTSYYCATVTDSATTPHTATSFATPFTIAQGLSNAISPDYPIIDSGQNLTLYATPAHGTYPYFYQWYTGTGCSPGSQINGQTSSSLTVGPLTSSPEYSVSVTDSSAGSPPASVCTSVIGAVSLPFTGTSVSLTPVGTVLDSGQTEVLYLTWKLTGTLPYVATLYQSSSSTCKSEVAVGLPHVGSVPEANFTVAPSSSLYYCATITDGSVTPESIATSAGTLVTVNAAIAPKFSLLPLVIDTGQTTTVRATVTWTGGTSPYTVTLFSGQSTSCGADTTKVAVSSGTNPQTGVTGNSASFAFVAPSSSTYYCASVSDRATTPVTVLVPVPPGPGKPAPAVQFTVNPVITATTSPAAPVIIDNGTSVTLTVQASHGTPPYFYQWYTGTGCAAGGAISGQTSSSYPTGAIKSTTSFSVRVTDNSTGTPAAMSCPGVTVTVNPALDPKLALSTSAIDTGQTTTVTATVSWTGGTSPYTVTLFSGTSTTCALDTTVVAVTSGTNPQTGITGNSATIAFKSPTANTEYCASVKDSATVPVTVYSSVALFTVNVALTTPNLRLSASAIDSGQTATLKANVTWSGGTSPYSVTLYSGTSPACSSDTTVAAVLSGSNPQSDLTADTIFSLTAPSSATYYCAAVSDGSAVPATASSSSSQFVVNRVLTAGIWPPSPAVDSGQSVAVTLTAIPSGGTSPYLYQWYAGSTCSSGAISGQTSSSYSPTGILSPETFSARVTDSSPGSPAASYCATTTVAVNPALSAPSLVLSPPVIDIRQNDSITATINWSGGTSLYSVTLYSGTSSTCSSDTTVVSARTGLSGTSVTFSFLAPSSTTYYCASLTDSAAFPVTTASVVEFLVNPALRDTVSPAAPYIDGGQSVTLTAAPVFGTPPYSYQWYKGTACPPGGSISGQTSQSYAASPASTTTYSVKVADSSPGVPLASVCTSVTVTVPGPLSVTITPVSPSIDSGQSITLTAVASQGVPPYHYQWYTGLSCVTQIIGQTGQTLVTGAINSTTSYSVLVGDNSSGTPAAGSCGSATFTPNTSFSGTAVTILASVKTLDSGQPVTLTVSWTGAGTSPYSVRLTTSASAGCPNPSPTGFLQTGIVGTSTTFTDTPSSTTYYCATVTDSALSPESTSTTAAALVTVAPTLGTPSLALSPPAIDSGQAATVTATVTWTGGTSPYTVELYSGPSASCASDTTVVSVTGSNPQLGVTKTSTTFSFASPSSTTYYCATVTDSPTTPVTTASSTTLFTVNSPLTVSISPSSPKIDTGQSIVLTATPLGGTPAYHYLWYSGSTCASEISPSDTTPTYTADAPASTGSFSVLVTDSSPGLPGTSFCASVTVTVDPVLAATISPASPAIDSGQYVTLTANPTQGTSPYFYQWYSGSGCATGGKLAGETSSSFFTGTLTTTTTFSVNVTDSSPGTPAADKCVNVTVTVDAALTAPVISASPTSVTSGKAATLNVTTSFGGGTPTYTCQWLEEAPGGTSFSALGGSFACTPPSPPSVSTGALTTAGTWQFELQVTDSSTNANVVYSNVVQVTVS